MLEWTGNCKFSLKVAFFCFECFLEFSSYRSPCDSEKQQPVQAHLGISGSQGTVKSILKNTLSVTYLKTKPDSSQWKDFFQK